MLQNNIITEIFATNYLISVAAMRQLQPLFLIFLVSPLNARLYNADILNLWLKYPLNGTINYYFFNFTNPDDFFNDETELIFEEKGPYKFSQENIRKNLVYNNNDTLSFRPVRTWKHISGVLDDEITIVNPGILVSYLTKYFRNMPDISNNFLFI